MVSRRISSSCTLIFDRRPLINLKIIIYKYSLVKYIFNTIGRFNDYAEGYVIHGFETTQLPSSPSSKKTKKPRIQSVIKPEAVLSSEIHTIQRSAKHIIILDAINHYQFKSLWFWMCWQMIAGRTFTYRSTHKFYLNGAGKVILHEELYSMREFLLEFAIIGFFYKLWIVFNTWLWVPTGLWEWVLQNCA